MFFFCKRFLNINKFINTKKDKHLQLSPGDDGSGLLFKLSWDDNFGRSTFKDVRLINLKSKAKEIYFFNFNIYLLFLLQKVLFIFKYLIFFH